MRRFSPIPMVVASLCAASLTGCIQLAAELAGAALAPPTMTAVPNIEAAPPPETAEAPPASAPPASTAAASTAEVVPELPPVTPPRDTVELVFEQHEMKRKLSVYAPPGAVAVRGALTEDLIMVGKEVLFVVGARQDNMELRKKDVARAVASRSGKLVLEEDHGVLWKDSYIDEDGQNATGYTAMWNIDVGGGTRHVCYNKKPVFRQAQAERILEMCRTLRKKP